MINLAELLTGIVLSLMIICIGYVNTAPNPSRFCDFDTIAQESLPLIDFSTSYFDFSETRRACNSKIMKNTRKENAKLEKEFIANIRISDFDIEISKEEVYAKKIQYYKEICDSLDSETCKIIYELDKTTAKEKLDSSNSTKELKGEIKEKNQSSGNKELESQINELELRLNELKSSIKKEGKE